MNLPNAITVARIAAAPVIAYLPFMPSSGSRIAAFMLFLAAAVTDYYDGMLARSRNLVTDLGRMLDPLADKLLLIGTFVPMYLLMGDPLIGRGEPPPFAFVTPWGDVPLPWWVVVVVLGREVFMTAFRQAAARRGVVIAAIGSAKLKTIFHFIWIGAAYFWFFARTIATERGWTPLTPWTHVAHSIGIIGVVAMGIAVVLTVYSLSVYLARYGSIFRAKS